MSNLFLRAVKKVKDTFTLSVSIDVKGHETEKGYFDKKLNEEISKSPWYKVIYNITEK